MPIVAKIGLTGGPGGGKTYFTSYSRQLLSDRGFRPVYLSEVASLFESYGIGPTSNVLSNLEYQYLIAKVQLVIESTLIESLEKSDDSIVLIFDRTVLDGKAYCTEDEWKIILERLDLKESYIYDRYDFVLHFVTTATGRNYSTENNPARSENKEQALEREKLNIVAYNGMSMSKKVILDNNMDFLEKQSVAFNAILGYLGLAEPIFGKQKKYLVYKVTKSVLENFCFKKIQISQTYLTTVEDEIEIRIRCVEDENEKSYYYTKKDKNRNIFCDKAISYEEYLNYMKDKVKEYETIEKIRYSFSFNNLYFQYDTFKSWREFAILEVQATNVANEIVLPEEFKVVAEVTDVTSLFNRSLAKNMLPEIKLKYLEQAVGVKK